MSRKFKEKKKFKKKPTRIDSIQSEKLFEELLREYPEVFETTSRLINNESLRESDKAWIMELSKATGWDEESIVDELKNIYVNPSQRIHKYLSLYTKYFEEAKKSKEKGDTQQASEKLWGAVVSLIKLYGAIKNIPIIHWSLGKLLKFVENSVEPEYRKLFRDLVDKSFILHIHFYEAELDKDVFETRWREALDLLGHVWEIVRNTLSRAL